VINLTAHTEELSKHEPQDITGLEVIKPIELYSILKLESFLKSHISILKLEQNFELSMI
jgi:hypothetical protein